MGRSRRSRAMQFVVCKYASGGNHFNYIYAKPVHPMGRHQLLTLPASLSSSIITKSVLSKGEKYLFFFSFSAAPLLLHRTYCLAWSAIQQRSQPAFVFHRSHKSLLNSIILSTVLGIGDFCPTLPRRTTPLLRSLKALGVTLKT